MSVSNAIASALLTTLQGTAVTSLLAGTLSIYRNQAPNNAPMPYIVYHPVGGGPQNITPSDLREIIYDVRCYATSAPRAGSIDAAVSNLLHHGTIAVTGYTNYWIARETEIELVDNPPGGVAIYSIGADYRISIDS